MLAPQVGMAKIQIKDLLLRTYIGINQSEIDNKQDVQINICILYQPRNAVLSTDIEDALNYRTICKAVISLVENRRFALLERLCQEVLDCVMGFERVSCAAVEVDKPHALRFSRSVSITLMAQNPTSSLE